MHHLIRNCRGQYKCLDDLARDISTERPGQTLPAQYFEWINTEERALLTLAARLCPQNNCGCERVLLEYREDLSRCILSGWEVWRALKARREIIFTPGYRSPSPELPGPNDLVKYIIRNCKKRPGEKPEDKGSTSSDDEPLPLPPAKRMRTGPCRDVMEKIERRKVEEAAKAKEATDKPEACSEEDEE
ncbi:hypothetical protein V5O48_010215 [Marasmius crinis-equi]|uniref:Uncharacterized protein n=1 Tax=Marasmius crinis-equi TaxID=585013 RepID=A0ABR3F921_9AGAR